MKKVEMFLAFSSITNKSVNVRYRNVFSFEKLNNQVNEKKLTCKISEFSFCPISVVGLQRNLLQRNTFWFLERFGEPAGIRTPDPRLRRPVLYPTELLTHLLNNTNYNSTKKKTCQGKKSQKTKKS